MIINGTNLQTLYTGFNAAFQEGLSQSPSQYKRIATIVPSTTRENEYGWLGKLPNVREWIGDRHIHNLQLHDYTIRNKDWELTIGVDRNDIEDDNIGVYKPLFNEMGVSAGAKKDMLAFGLLKQGWDTTCYDGQYFFDTDHKVLDEKGVEQSVANTTGGAGAPWFLIDDKRALKPIILQDRKDWKFVARNQPNDNNVFDQKKYIYGIDGRFNVGFGLWQLAYGSKQPPNSESYGAARASLMGMKGDHGRPLGIMPSLLVVPPALEGAARAIVSNDMISEIVGGAPVATSNPWKGTADVLVVPWLA